MPVTIDDIRTAAETIAGHVVRTPAVSAPRLAAATGAASVVLKLRDSRGLPPSAVAGISNLVAASVEGLRPEAVVILDSMGRPLSQPSDGGDEVGGAAQMERQLDSS